MFLARTRELAFLDELYQSGRPEFFVLHGRRRVGKTELLQQFCQSRRAVYFLAAQVREKDNLRALRDALAAKAGVIGLTRSDAGAKALAAALSKGRMRPAKSSAIMASIAAIN